MTKWLIFDLLMGVMPVILGFLGLLMIYGRNWKLVSIVGDGGLLFFSAALAGSLCGDLFDLAKVAVGDSLRNSLYSCIILGGFLILFSSFGFGIAVAGPETARMRIGIASILCAATTSLVVFVTRFHYDSW